MSEPGPGPVPGSDSALGSESLSEPGPGSAAAAEAARAPISRGRAGDGAAPLRANKGRDPGVRESRAGGRRFVGPPCLLCLSKAHNILTKAD